MNTKEIESLLIEWRKSVLQRDTLEKRVAILRQLVASAKAHKDSTTLEDRKTNIKNWEAAIFHHEKARLHEIEKKIMDSKNLSRRAFRAFLAELKMFANFGESYFRDEVRKEFYAMRKKVFGIIVKIVGGGAIIGGAIVGGTIAGDTIPAIVRNAIPAIDPMQGGVMGAIAGGAIGAIVGVVLFYDLLETHSKKNIP